MRRPRPMNLRLQLECMTAFVRRLGLEPDLVDLTELVAEDETLPENMEALRRVLCPTTREIGIQSEE